MSCSVQDPKQVDRCMPSHCDDVVKCRRSDHSLGGVKKTDFIFPRERGGPVGSAIHIDGEAVWGYRPAVVVQPTESDGPQPEVCPANRILCTVANRMHSYGRTLC